MSPVHRFFNRLMCVHITGHRVNWPAFYADGHRKCMFCEAHMPEPPMRRHPSQGD